MANWLVAVRERLAIGDELAIAEWPKQATAEHRSQDAPRRVVENGTTQPNQLIVVSKNFNTSGKAQLAHTRSPGVWQTGIPVMLQV